jgi:hypothetical protein
MAESGRLLLGAMDVEPIVHDERCNATSGNTATARAASSQFEGRSGKAVSTIPLACLDSIAPYLNAMQNPDIMWDTPEQCFETGGHAPQSRQFRNQPNIALHPIHTIARQGKFALQKAEYFSICRLKTG